MGLLLGLLLLSHLLVVIYGHPILEVPESVTGPWKGDVNIPCTYGPLQGYTQVLVKWLVERGSDSVTIFLRDPSGDHIQQAKYRGRLHVNHEVPGDVSLQLNTLEMDDRSHYTCEVTWQTPDGNQVVRDKIVELRVQKRKAMAPHSSTLAWKIPWTEEPDSSKPLETKTKSLPTMQTPLEVNTPWGRITEVDGDIGKTSAGPGKGLSIFAIILIISLCCIVFITMTYIMVCQKTSQQDHVYEVARFHAREASDSGETMRVALFASGCSNEEPDSQTLGNDYSDEPCLSQEYQIITQINSDYARLLHTDPLDYELLATKGKNVC